jgi:hypothetical protein
MSPRRPITLCQAVVVVQLSGVVRAGIGADGVGGHVADPPPAEKLALSRQIETLETPKAGKDFAFAAPKDTPLPPPKTPPGTRGKIAHGTRLGPPKSGPTATGRGLSRAPQVDPQTSAAPAAGVLPPPKTPPRHAAAAAEQGSSGASQPGTAPAAGVLPPPKVPPRSDAGASSDLARTPSLDSTAGSASAKTGGTTVLPPPGKKPPVAASGESRMPPPVPTPEGQSAPHRLLGTAVTDPTPPLSAID